MSKQVDETKKYFSKHDYLTVKKTKKLSFRESEYYRTIRDAHRKMEITDRKDAKYLRKQKFKEKRRKTRNLWRINAAIEAIIGLIKDPVQKEYFTKLYEKRLTGKRHYNSFERFLLAGLKQQRKIRRKRYSIISSYKWQKLDSPKKLQKFWNFFYNRKIKSTANTTFVKWHSQKLYTLKRAFRFFYGYLKNNIWKKSFLKSKRKSNKLLHFLSYLENRLCICLFRMNFVLSMRQAKQFIRHGFVSVNGRIIRYCNYLLKKNDIISVNLNAIIKYVWTKNGELDYSILIARPPRQMLHLHVNHRISTGIFLYDPKIAFQLRTPHTPNFFFGKDEIKFEYVDFYKDTKNEKAFNNYVKRKAAEKQKKIRNKNPILETYHSKRINYRDKVPLKNVRLILSFFMKK